MKQPVSVVTIAKKSMAGLIIESFIKHGTTGLQFVDQYLHPFVIRGKRTDIPEEKLDETFTSIPPEELGYGDDEPEEDASDTPRASGSSFDEIDDACKTAKNPDATQAEREKAAKVFTDMEGTELYEKMMEGSSEIGIRIKGLIEIRLKKSEKEFVVPDNIEEFDIRNYV